MTIRGSNVGFDRRCRPRRLAAAGEDLFGSHARKSPTTELDNSRSAEPSPCPASTDDVLANDRSCCRRWAKGYERGKTPGQPNHMVDWVNCIQSRGTPKCSTDEAFIETATFLMSLVSQQERRVVRWDATNEAIV